MYRGKTLQAFTVIGLVFLIGSAGFALPAWAQTWELIWADEFDGTEVDQAKWTFQLGDGCPDLCGWGNNELEWYQAENATVADGFLTITAKEEQAGGKNYTSARMRTINQGDWTYGRFEVRAKMPIGKGLWPAIWMLPTDPSIYGTWAASGEIDIMEYVGDKPAEVLGTIHYGAPWPGNQFSSNTFTLQQGTFNDDFHVFAVEWEQGKIRWYVDEVLYATQTSWSSTGGSFPAPFDVDFHLILNVAVGGNLPGDPDASTTFPQAMVVDYVRVFRDTREGGGAQGEMLFDDMEHGDPGNNGWFAFGGSVGGGGIGASSTDLPPSDGGSFSLEAGFGGDAGFIGGFGRTNRLDLTETTHFNFWINPDAGQAYTLEVNLQDDDNGDEEIPSPSADDDEYQFNCVVSDAGPCATSGGGWQLVSIPFTDFADDNSFHTGGNAVFDPTPVSAGGNGQLVNVVFAIIGTGTDVNFRTDNWVFADSSTATAVEGPAEVPRRAFLGAAYPNPFSRAAQFDLMVEEAQRVTVELVDLLGRTVAVLHEGLLRAQETRSLKIEGEGLPSGIYLYRVTGERFVESRRVVLVR